MNTQQKHRLGINFPKRIYKRYTLYTITTISNEHNEQNKNLGESMLNEIALLLLAISKHFKKSVRKQKILVLIFNNNKINKTKSNSFKILTKISLIYILYIINIMDQCIIIKSNQRKKIDN